jgi:hypothetical protein
LTSLAEIDFLRENKNRLALLADCLGYLWPDRPKVMGRLHRWAGEPDTRFVLLMDARGIPLMEFGDAPSDEERRVLFRAKPLEGVTLSSRGAAVGMSTAVWVDGEKVGVLSWARWTPAPDRRRARERRALGMFFFWWAAAWGLAVFFLTHGFSHFRPTLPLDNFGLKG